MSTWTVPSYAGDWTVPGYTEERRLGRGASGRVVAAVEEATGRRVAIKYLSPALLRDPSYLWAFRSEASLLKTLDVPQVVQVFNYVEEPGQGAAIIMELVNGVSLHEMITRNGATSAESALVVLKGSLLGLAAAHALGIVHRDYKPENVLVDAEGNSKLADFGVAVKAGKHVPTAGTPLYMAPEEWNGAPSSPTTDIYAATAVFYECLTGKTPFSGKLGQLRQQHETAAVPLDGIGAPALRSLIARGMAKNPADRPATAIAFVAELESAAAAAYGPAWEERGRGQLAERAAALLALLAGGVVAAGHSSGVSWLLRRRTLTIAGIAVAAVVAVAAVAMASLTGNKGHSDPPQSGSSSSSVTTNMPTITAQAAVTPPVAASKCTAAAAFTYTGTLTASGAGNVSYQWVYSSGQPGPVQTVSFTEAGHRQVTGETLRTATAGTGWAEIKMISPAGTSNKASYRLVCASGAGGINAVAAMQSASASVTCGAPVPSFTATGSITSLKAETVTYYWALSDGRTTAPATLTFTGPGTLAAEPLTLTPLGDPSSGQAVLVVSSPVSAVSSPAPYTLTCQTPLKLTASVTASPATDTLASCNVAVPAITFTGSVSDNQAGTVSYYWKLPSGNSATQTLTFAAAGTQKVTTTYKPASDTATGSASVVVTSPGSATSNAATFTLKCAPLTIASTAAATATVGTAYSGTVTVTGGKSPYTWAATTGLPTGLTATANAGTLTISGTPTAAGTFPVKVSVSDSSSPKATSTSTITITVSAAPLKITTTALTAATQGAAYSATLAASGGAGTDTWSATGLPAGLTMSAAGVISGTPTASGTFSVAATVTDTASPAQTATATLPLTVSAGTLKISSASLAAGTAGAAYSATLTATGGSGTDTWSATGLPAGLTISSTGTVSGTPTKAGTYSVTVTVKDTGSPAQSASATISLVINAAPATAG